MLWSYDHTVELKLNKVLFIKTIIYTVRHKNTPNCFYHNLKKGYPILIMFGTHIHDTTGR